jgi:hypothetical protein
MVELSKEEKEWLIALKKENKISYSAFVGQVMNRADALAETDLTKVLKMSIQFRMMCDDLSNPSNEKVEMPNFG